MKSIVVKRALIAATFVAVISTVAWRAKVGSKLSAFVAQKLEPDRQTQCEDKGKKTSCPCGIEAAVMGLRCIDSNAKGTSFMGLGMGDIGGTHYGGWSFVRDGERYGKHGDIRVERSDYRVTLTGTDGRTCTIPASECDP